MDRWQVSGAMDRDERVRLGIDGAIAVITNDNPGKHNAFDDSMDATLFDILAELRGRPEIRAVIWRGEGKSWSSGRDVGSIGINKTDLTHHEVMTAGIRGIQQLWEVEGPIIVAIHGWALGGSFQRALLCDIRIASTDARFMLPEVGHGVIPDTGGVYVLYEMCGHRAGERHGPHGSQAVGVSVGCEPRMDAVVEGLLQELSDGKEEKVKLIARCNLDEFLWEQMSRCYGYKSAEPGMRDFVIELFKSGYAMGTDGQAKLNGDALVFLKRWKDSRLFESCFEALSAECADVLGIEQDLAKRDFRELIEVDYFRLIDQKIISDLVRAVSARTISSSDVALWVRQRMQGHWYKEYRHLYDAIDYAAQFIFVERSESRNGESGRWCSAVQSLLVANRSALSQIYLPRARFGSGIFNGRA